MIFIRVLPSAWDERININNECYEPFSVARDTKQPPRRDDEMFDRGRVEHLPQLAADPSTNPPRTSIPPYLREANPAP